MNLVLRPSLGWAWLSSAQVCCGLLQHKIMKISYQSFIVKENISRNLKLAKSEASVSHHSWVIFMSQHSIQQSSHNLSLHFDVPILPQSLWLDYIIQGGTARYLNVFLVNMPGSHCYCQWTWKNVTFPWRTIRCLELVSSLHMFQNETHGRGH